MLNAISKKPWTHILADFITKLPLAHVRATGHKTPGESSVDITLSDYNTTHLQENPQRLG